VSLIAVVLAVSLSSCGGGGHARAADAVRSTTGAIRNLVAGGGSRTSRAEKVLRDRIARAERRLRANPRDRAALRAVVRGHYQLASIHADVADQFDRSAHRDLLAAANAWQHYLATNPSAPDTGIARVMVHVYGGLAQLSSGDPAVSRVYWAGAASATELIAAAQPNSANYVALVQYASLAGQTDKARLAGEKAVQLAPKSQRKSVAQQVAAAKALAARP
jgi:hypothetical protein